MLLRAGPDYVQLQVGLRVSSVSTRRGGGEVPSVDVIVAEIIHARDGGVEGLEGFEGFGGEGCSFGGQNGLLRVDSAEEGDSAAILVCR